jgi:cell fate regulator YaaT (PSP1 superfamily)
MYAQRFWGARESMTLYQIQIDSQARPAYAAWEGASLRRQTACIIQTEAGETFGQVLEARAFLKPCISTGQVLRFVRLATEDDHKRRAKHRQIERDAFVYCRDKARSMKLDMKLIQVHLYFDESRLLFVYTSEGRVDFRELVRDLAHRFHLRIEMRQVGVRDEAKLLGGYGHCGRPLCCSSHLGQFYPITIRMAKDQGLSLNPAKISGRCGRLMCCLRYECPSRRKGGASSQAGE